MLSVLLLLLTLQVRKLLLQRVQALLVHFAQPCDAVCVQLLVQPLLEAALLVAEYDLIHRLARRLACRRRGCKTPVDRFDVVVAVFALERSSLLGGRLLLEVVIHSAKLPLVHVHRLRAPASSVRCVAWCGAGPAREG